MPKIPEISVEIQMERSVSVSSDRTNRDHLTGGPLISVGIQLFRERLSHKSVKANATMSKVITGITVVLQLLD